MMRSTDPSFPKHEKVTIVEADVLSYPDKMATAFTGATHVIFAAAGRGGQHCVDVDNNGYVILVRVLFFLFP